MTSQITSPRFRISNVKFALSLSHDNLVGYEFITKPSNAQKQEGCESEREFLFCLGGKHRQALRSGCGQTIHVLFLPLFPLFRSTAIQPRRTGTPRHRFNDAHALFYVNKWDDNVGECHPCTQTTIFPFRIFCASNSEMIQDICSSFAPASSHSEVLCVHHIYTHNSREQARGSHSRARRAGFIDGMETNQTRQNVQCEIPNMNSGGRGNRCAD